MFSYPQAETGADPGAIHDFILNQIAPLLPGDMASRYDAFHLMVLAALNSIQ